MVINIRVVPSREANPELGVLATVVLAILLVVLYSIPTAAQEGLTEVWRFGRATTSCRYEDYAMHGKRTLHISANDTAAAVLRLINSTNDEVLYACSVSPGITNAADSNHYWISDNEQYLVIAQRDSLVFVDMESGRVIHNVAFQFNGVAWCDDQGQQCIVYDDNYVYVYDRIEGRRQRVPLPSQPYRCTRIPGTSEVQYWYKAKINGFCLTCMHDIYKRPRSWIPVL